MAMIDKSFQFVLKYLNREFELSYGLGRDVVVAGSVVNPDGSMANGFEDRIVMSLIGLEQENSIKNGQHMHPVGNNFTKSTVPVYLNMYLLFSANFDSGNYLEGLKMISKVILTFQANPFFSNKTHPEMNGDLEKLTFEIYNLSTSDISHVWSGIGAKYMPSIVYKVRMIGFDGDLIIREISGINKMHGNVK